MVGFVVAIGVMNFALGAAVAHFLLPPRRTRVVIAPQAAEPPPPEPVAEPVVEAAAPVEPAAEAPVVAPAREVPREADVPREWLERLEESLVTGTFIEAAIQVLRLEVGKYRNRLVELELELRGLGDPLSAEALGDWSQRLAEMNEAWLAQQSEAAGHLRDRQTDLTSGNNLAGELESTLLMQQAQIETTLNNLRQIQLAADPTAARKKLLEELRRLLDLAHALRDQMHASLATVLDSEKSLSGCDPRLLVDGLTNFRSRAGLAAMMSEWLEADPGRTRLSSAALLDLDRFGRINEQHGATLADELLRVVAELLDSHVRRDRGFDVLARFTGQQFLLFFGDTGPRQATAACERFRQAVEGTTFENGESEIALTATAGIAEFRAGETPEQLFGRLAKCLSAAKAGGQNRSFLDEGAGPTAVDPPEFAVKHRAVRLRG
ncbi:MAG: GGDEF domain-containing protein [Pirellulales bacterium]